VVLPVVLVWYPVVPLWISVAMHGPNRPEPFDRTDRGDRYGLRVVEDADAGEPEPERPPRIADTHILSPGRRGRFRNA